MRGIVGTAGHIDHGKTALIAALTGTHTDRLPEEQERGISIDLGFTHLETRDGVLGVIDVPGHEDFVRNMLAGATGTDLLLLVVAADEGVMPQTREHVAIAELLGVHTAVVALTKTDLVDDDWLGLVYDDLADFLAETPFAGAPVVPVSATEGTGVEDVRAAIADVFEGARGQTGDVFRLPIDRTFTVRGTGTVVTGTVWSGALEKDQPVRLLPGDREVRVRGLQVHGADVDRVEAGQRAAVALAGIDREDVSRGTTAVRHHGWEETLRVTAEVRVLPYTAWALEAWQRVRVHVGTAEVMARAVPLDAERLEPGDSGWVQLRLEAPLVARTRDRLVIRSYSPVTTMAGGRVAEPLAPKRTAVGAEDRSYLDALLNGAPEQAVEAFLAARGGAGARPEELPLWTGFPPADVEEAAARLDVVTVGGRAFHAGTADRVQARITDVVEAYHERAPLRPGMDPEALRQEAGKDLDPALVDASLDHLLEAGVLATERGAVRRPDFEPRLSPDQEATRDRIRARIADAGVAAPRTEELREQLGADEELEDLLALLEAEGAVVRVQHDLHLDATVLEEAIGAVKRRLGGQAGLSPGAFREVLEVSRRHLIPLLEYMDRVGVTARGRDGRSVRG